jgi:hypothetical protein
VRRTNERRYSITSSAATSRLCGTARPRAFAVLKLITTSYLRLYRQIRRLLVLEDAIDVAGCAPGQVDPIRPVGDQAPTNGFLPITVERGQLVLGRKCDDEVAMIQHRCARRYDQAAVRRAGEAGDGALDLARLAHADGTVLNPERLRCALDGAELPDPDKIGIPNNSGSHYVRRDLLEKFPPFAMVLIRRTRRRTNYSYQYC